MPNINKIGVFENKDLCCCCSYDNGEISELYWNDVLICNIYKLARIITLNNHAIEILSTDDENALIATFITFNHEFYNTTTFHDAAKIKINEDLMDIKCAIVPRNNKLALFSYEYGFVTSALYDEMVYVKKSKTFNVGLKIKTFFGQEFLFGSLDLMGHLIGDTLYSPETCKGYLIDEHNIDLIKLKESLEKDIVKQRKHDDYFRYEYEAYLKRRKK